MTIRKHFHKNKKNLHIFLLFFLIIPFNSALGQTRIGISGVGGAGLFIASDKDYYGGISTDLYPEIGVQLDISIIRMGLKFAYIYRKVEEWGWGWYYDYTLAYVPVQAEFLIAPLSATSKDYLFSPYAGVMAGTFVAVGDNDKSLLALSLKFGAEANLEPLLLYGDIRYTYAPDENFWGDDVNAGGVMIVAGMGLRFGLSK